MSFIAKIKKVRKCPHCKSKRGFKIQYDILGTGTLTLDFRGNLIDTERECFDRFSLWAECLDCGKSIDAEAVNLEKN